MASIANGESIRTGTHKDYGREVVPTVMVGLGGTGKDVLLLVRRKFFDRFGDLDEFPVVSYVFIDTDAAAKTPMLQAGAGDDIPARIQPRAHEFVKAVVENPEHYTRQLELYPHIARWLSPKLHGMFAIVDGAGRYRQKSRLAFFHNFEQIDAYIRQAVERSRDPRSREKVASRHGLGVAADKVQFLIVGSLAGGTGSGMFLDTSFLLRHRYGGARRVGYLVTAEVFGDDPWCYANTYAALRELEHFNFLSDWDYQWTHGVPGESGVPKHVFDNCFIITGRNRFGQYKPDLEGRKSLFDMIGEQIFQEFGTSAFAEQRRAIRVNLISDLERTYALHLPGESGARSGSLRHQFPEIYGTFGLSVLRVPLDRIKKAAAYQLAGEVTQYWTGGGGGPSGSVQVRDFVKAKVLSALGILEEKTDSGRHDILDRLYKDPRTGASFSDECRGFVAKLRAQLQSADVMGAVTTEVDRFRNEKFAAGGSFTKQMDDNSAALIAELEKGMAGKIAELINRERMAASLDVILKDLRALLDDPQEAYIPQMERDRTNLGRIADQRKALFEKALSELAEAKAWSNPLKLPFKDLAVQKCMDTALAALRDHLEARVKRDAREKALAVARSLKDVLARRTESGAFLGEMKGLADYLARMSASYRRNERLMQVKDLYREEDFESEYYPKIAGKDGTPERRKAVEQASGLILRTLAAAYPTVITTQEPMALLELVPKLSLTVEALGDMVAASLGGMVAELDKHVNVAERALSELNPVQRQDHVRLCDPWFVPEPNLEVRYTFDARDNSKFLIGRPRDATQWRDLFAELSRVLPEMGATSDVPVVELQDASQIIFYAERWRFPLFYGEMTKRYKQIYEAFARSNPDVPLHIDSSLRGLRQICPPTLTELERERTALKALLLARIFKGPFKVEEKRRPDGVVERGLYFEWRREEDRYAGLRESRYMGTDPEEALKTLIADEALLKAVVKATETRLGALLGSPFWPEVRALLLWYLHAYFPPESAASAAIPDTPRWIAESPERKALEEVLGNFDGNISRLADGGKKGLSDFTERVLGDQMRSAAFAPEDGTQTVFAREGFPWRVYAPEEGRSPAVSL